MKENKKEKTIYNRVFEKNFIEQNISLVADALMVPEAQKTPVISMKEQEQSIKYYEKVINLLPLSSM